jgi:hypothetical protein
MGFSPVGCKCKICIIRFVSPDNQRLEGALVSQGHVFDEEVENTKRGR